MPGRSFTSDNYRYGFNGKEKDDELKGTGNSLDFGARLLDPRLGRWLSTDPRQSKYPDISSYASFGNNPMIFVDPGGDTLRLAGDLKIAFDDVLSLVPEKYQSRLKLMSDNTVEFNISRKEVATSNDVGVLVVDNLIRSNKNFEYNVDNQQMVVDSKTGLVKSQPVKHVSEYSNSYHNILRSGAKVGNKGVNPRIDRGRTIHPDDNGGRSGTRPALVMHEFLEMKFQEDGHPYTDYNNPENGAHSLAIDLQRLIPSYDRRHGYNPGGGKYNRDGGSGPPKDIERNMDFIPEIKLR